MKYLNPNDWKPADGLTLEANALTTVKSTSNTIVTAGPGAGKTELLAQRASYLLATNTCCLPTKILAISFKRDAADNLANRVKERTDESLHDRFHSFTYDAFAKTLLDRFRYGLPEDYRPHADYIIETETLPESIISAFEIILPGSTTGFSKWERSARLKSLISTLSTNPYPLQNDNLASQTLKELLNETQKSVVNFSIISRLVHYLLRENPMIVSYLRQTYTHLFLDEFQDTTKRQYDLLTTAFKGSSTIITAVGDPKQRIMLWAGAMPDIFNVYKTDFTATDIPLFRNYRSAPKLIQLQNALAENLLGSKVTCQPAPDATPDDGIAVFHFFDNYKQEALEIAEYIKGLIESQAIPPREICLLYKQQPEHFGQSMIQALADQEINARVENQFQDMMTEPIVRFILNLLQGTSKTDGVEARNSLIYAYCNLYHIHNEEAALMEELKVHRRLNTLTDCIAVSAEWPPIEAVINQVIEEITFQRFSANYPRYNDPEYFNKCKQGCLDNFRDAYAITGSLTKAINTFLGIDSVPLMTVHKSKGLEFEVVFFIGFEDKTFWNYHKQSEEDTRSFFVAMSRAKRHINFTFCATRFNNFKKHDNRSLSAILPIYKVLETSGLVMANDRRSTV
jgi:superfamily I DNA/RNA helicase